MNQGGTYKHEVPGGYMWSPKQNNNGSYSQYYENMRSVEPGDVVLSYAHAEIRAIGVALGTAYEAPKPVEFGTAGALWADLGWRVDVLYSELQAQDRVRPKELLAELLPLRPAKYSPIQSNGNGVTAYLFEVSESFAHVPLSRLESVLEWNVIQALQRNDIDLRRIGEDKVEQFLLRAPLDETEKKALVAARRGQGRFRHGVSHVEPACRFTGVTNPTLLVASHIRPWHRCQSNHERLDPNNGLMLTPTYDRLFDRGLVTFTPDSQLVISSRLPVDDIRKIRMDTELRLEPFRPEQQRYLEYHRDHVFGAA